ncbi:MAG TPA: class I SAM-dependent methyltransferase [Thermodesulfobacteriota bacterium]|jgi:ubiquinone/menaquinone biosynthesis C-methylase UbiE
MILNKIEFSFINSRTRAFIQDKFELKDIRRLSSLPSNKVVLEIGCGNGTGARLIKRYFSPLKIYAVDLDQRMISMAKRYNADDSIIFELGDATKLRFMDEQFDAVFDFGVIHHIPNWEDCVRELNRVLKISGELIVEDFSIETFETATGKILRKLTNHPYERMYRRKDLIECMKNSGFEIMQEKRYHPLHLIKYFLMIAKRIE